MGVERAALIPAIREKQMDEKQLHGYEEGLRDGRIQSLEKTVETLSTDLGKIKTALWMLYGAIALVQFLPTIENFISAR